MDSKLYFLERERSDGTVATLAYRRTEAPAATGRPGVLFCGGYRSDMTGTKASRLHAHCAAAGLAFTRFDYQGHGESDGAFVEGTIGEWYRDACAIFDRATQGRQVVIGSSMGGWMAMLLARDRPDRIAGLILLAPAPDFPTALMEPSLTNEQRAELMAQGQTLLASAYNGDGYPLRQSFLEEARRHNLLDGPKIPVQGPVRILHGDSDPDVPLAHGFETAAQLDSRDLVLEAIKGGDHRLSTDRDLAHLCRRVDEMVSLVAG